MPKVVIRPATRSDVPAITQLSRSLAHHVADPDPGEDTTEIRDALFGTPPWADAVVACHGNDVVGFALFCWRFEAHTRTKTLWLADLLVSPNARSTGVGRSLLDGVRGEARRLGCSGVTLEVWKRNAAALAFYKRLDAQPVDDITLLYFAAGDEH